MENGEGTETSGKSGTKITCLLSNASADALLKMVTTVVTFTLFKVRLLVVLLVCCDWAPASPRWFHMQSEFHTICTFMFSCFVLCCAIRAGTDLYSSTELELPDCGVADAILASVLHSQETCNKVRGGGAESCSEL